MEVLVKEEAFDLLESVMVSDKIHDAGICVHRKFDRCVECNIPPRIHGYLSCEHGRNKYTCQSPECGGIYRVCLDMKNRIKNRAKQKNILCTLTACDIYDLFKIAKGVCPVLGLSFEYHKGMPVDGSPSIDRHVPEKGYVKGNCSIISHLANRLKSNGTPGQLQKVANYTKKVQGVK